jgi:hypothetical protein
MRTGILIIMVCLMSCVLAYGQSGKKKKRNKEKSSTEISQPTTMDPNYSILEDYAPKSNHRVKSAGITYDAQKRFYERREEIEKDRRKAEKELMKPQYSDPMYFGHKHPPKKHKPGKMKYCKVCGIRH